MRNISAEVVFSYMTPDALADFILNLPDDGETSAKLCDMAYDELTRLVGTKDADDMLEEKES